MELGGLRKVKKESKRNTTERKEKILGYHRVVEKNRRVRCLSCTLTSEKIFFFFD